MQSFPHWVKPLGQPHAPFQQRTPSLHAFPHAPQFFGSSPVEVSHPSAAAPLQSACISSHAIRHWPSLHREEPCADDVRSGQGVSHAPQCSTSLRRSTLHGAATPGHVANGAGHSVCTQTLSTRMPASGAMSTGSWYSSSIDRAHDA